MKKTWLLLSSIACLALLTACGSATMPLKPEISAGLKSIAIIRIADPAQYTMFNRGSLAMAAGALGAAAAAVSSQRNAKNVTGAMLRANFKFGQQLTEDLTRHLQGAGYRTVVVSYPREPSKLIDDYVKVSPADADAVLDVIVTAAGYSTENWAYSSHWRPEAWVEVALYAPKLGQVVYREKLLYGYGNPFMSATQLEAPEQFHFKDKETLLAAADQTLADGLKEASRAIAAHIANQLKKK